MTAVLYILNVILSSGQVTLSRQYSRMGGKADDFNVCKAISGAVAFVIMALITGASWHMPTILFGSLYGVFLCISMYTGFKALETGPMALTSILSSFSLIIPLVVGITLWNERMTTASVTGVFLMLFSIVLINIKKGVKTSPRWLMYALSTMLSNGVCSVIQKLHQTSYPQKYKTEFMISALLVVLLLLTAGKMRARSRLIISKTGLCAGVMNGASNYIVLLLASTVNASILFPMVSVTNIIAVWLISSFLYRERLKYTQLAGVFVGIISIVLLNM